MRVPASSASSANRFPPKVITAEEHLEANRRVVASSVSIDLECALMSTRLEKWSTVRGPDVVVGKQVVDREMYWQQNDSKYETRAPNHVCVVVHAEMYIDVLMLCLVVFVY